MLRFFRTLRRKLLEEDNVRKYFWYALGEVLLVVIGILIALQINNWNEERKEREREQVALERLFVESETIVSYFKNEIGWIQGWIDKIDTTTQVLFEGTYDELEENQIGVLTSLYPTSFAPRGVFDELSNAGQFKEIQSNEVRTAIIDYYRMLSFFEGQLYYFRNVQPEPELFAGNAIRSTYDKSSTVRREFVIDLEALSKNEEFKSELVDGLRNQIQFQSFRQNVLDSAIEMCDALAEELNTICESKSQEIEDAGPESF